jgi:polar amino acid transport system permease protein
MVRPFGNPEILFILSGLVTTMVLSLIAFAGGSLGGLAVALARTSQSAALRKAAWAFIEFFQNTPLLLQLFLCFYGLPILGLNVSPWSAVAVGLTFHASAFLGEIWRGGIEAVPRGQTEAAKALGIGYFRRMRAVIMPQALRISLAPTTGFLVQLVKGTSLAAIIGFVELSRSAQIISGATYRPLLAYGFAGLCYFAICFPLSRLSDYLETKLKIKTN